MKIIIHKKYIVGFVGGVIASAILSTSVFAHEESGTMHLLDNQYDPSMATIYKGEQIVFENASFQQRWPDLTYTIAPKHKTYEYSPNEPLAPGEKWIYKFDYAGTWQYKDKKNPSIQGNIKVIVGRGYSHVEPQIKENWWDVVIRFIKSLFGISY